MASSPTLSSDSRTTSSLRPLLIYWVIGMVVGLAYLRSEMTQLPTAMSGAHLAAIAAGLLATVVTTLAYKQVTTYGMRSLHLPTLFGFSLANGICETILFFASFKIGVAIAASFTTQSSGHSSGLFWSGITSFFVYSAAIHALFWLKILPPHLNKSPAVKNIRRVWIIGLVALSLAWGWLFFAYQDFWSVAALHILFDAGMVHCIRYRLA